MGIGRTLGSGGGAINMQCFNKSASALQTGDSIVPGKLAEVLGWLQAALLPPMAGQKWRRLQAHKQRTAMARARQKKVVLSTVEPSWRLHSVVRSRRCTPQCSCNMAAGLAAAYG